MRHLNIDIENYTLERDNRELQPLSFVEYIPPDYTLERDNRELQLNSSAKYTMLYYTLERDNRELQRSLNE